MCVKNSFFQNAEAEFHNMEFCFCGSNNQIGISKKEKTRFKWTKIIKCPFLLILSAGNSMGLLSSVDFYLIPASVFWNVFPFCGESALFRDAK